MSGNQYAYSLEVTRGAAHSLTLVAKNRKEIRAKVAGIITNANKTHDVVRQSVQRDLSILTYMYGGKMSVCEEYLLRPRPLPGFLGTSIEIVVKCWIIKKAVPDGPVRGTLKERMGDRAWKPTILLDPIHGGDEKYPDPPADGRVT